MDFSGYFSQLRDTHLEQMKQYLRIPSISTLSENKGDVRRTAEWTADALRTAGMEKVELIETKGHPIVYGEWLQAAGKPTVLIYGHYDVQPVDPVHLWDSPPFEPTERDGKLYARGATDDKGQVFIQIKAVEAWMKQAGSLPVNVKFLVEGEEELGSPNLPAFLEQNAERLKADCVLISDSAMIARGVPTLYYGLRGLCAMQIDVQGAKTDLHSGEFGGAVANPIHALAELLSTMHDRDGRIAVEGFYDDVPEVTAEESEAFRQLPFDEAEVQRGLEVDALYGEPGYSFLERTGARPTLEINGIWGGFQGEGTKTVLPSEAHAKITCRLVGQQKPERIWELIERHVEKHTLPGVRVTVKRQDRGNPFVMPIDHPVFDAAKAAYRQAFGADTVFARSGGSIPVVAALNGLLGVPVVLMGYGSPGENLHAPNEHFYLDNFDRGLVAASRFLGELAEVKFG